jgi:hypothetical protein
LLKKWHDHIQAIGGAALKDGYQDFALIVSLRCCANQPGWDGGPPGHSSHRH